MEKKCGNCKYFVELDMPLPKECISCGNMKHFEQKPITNRQWLETLNDEKCAVVMVTLFIVFEYDKLTFTDWLKAEHKADWLQAEHKE